MSRGKSTTPPPVSPVSPVPLHPRLAPSVFLFSLPTFNLQLFTSSSSSFKLSPFTVVHPLSVQLFTKCSSRNSFIFKTIHFDGGCTPLHEEKMNSTTTNPSFTIETPAVTSRDDSALPPSSQASRPRTSREGRCQHLFPNGKRCRKFAPASRLGLCITHFEASAAIGAALQQDQSDFTDLSADLLPELSEYSAGT